MKWYEALLLSLGVATLTLIEAIGAAALFEGPHYLASLRHRASFVSLWITYAWIFAACGGMGWLLSWALRRHPRAWRRGGLFLTLLPMFVPLVIAPMRIRPKLEGVLLGGAALPVGLVVLVGLLAWLAHAATRGGTRACRASSWVLLGLIATLGIADCFVLYQLAPEILSFQGLGRLFVATVAACALSLPLLLALRNAHARPVPVPLATAFGTLAVVLLALVYLGGHRSPGPLSSRAPAEDSLPPVLLIVVDTLRADFVVDDGHVPDNVPHVEDLTRDGVIFERAYATAPWTTASFGSILSSTYPSQHRAGMRDPQWNFKSPMADSVTCLAEVLSDAGYWTGAVLTNPYLGTRFHLDRGFAAYEDLMAIRWYHPVFYGVPIQSFQQWRSRIYVPAPLQTARIERMVRRGRASDRPFFVLAHYMDPHTPYAAPEPFGKGANGSSLLEAYRDEVAFFDHHLGQLLARLQELGLYDDLLIVLTSDHGEELFEERLGAPAGTRRHDHGHTLFNELVHVPFIIKWPGSRQAGTRRSEPISLLDIAPTVTARAGLEVPAAFRGRVIHEDARSGLGPGPQVLFAEGTLYGPEQKAAIEGPRKVILHEVPFSLDEASAYDLGADPAERRPLPLSDAPEDFRNVTNALVEFVETQTMGAGDQPIEPDPLLRQQLEALGYTN